MANTLSYFLQKMLDKKKTLRAENSQIIYCLQTSLTQMSLAKFSHLGLALITKVLANRATFLLLHQLLIYRTYVFL